MTTQLRTRLVVSKAFGDLTMGRRSKVTDPTARSPPGDLTAFKKIPLEYLQEFINVLPCYKEAPTLGTEQRNGLSPCVAQPSTLNCHDRRARRLNSVHSLPYSFPFPSLPLALHVPFLE